MSDANEEKAAKPAEHQIAALVHGRYLLAGSEDTNGPLLVGFHGYGEGPEANMEALRRIPGAERWQICAVAALNRFYNTKTGKVIGSWMTSQNREQTIEDNIRYVASVIALLRRDNPGRPLVIAGFSQGVAMAYRAAARAGHPCSGLLVLAGDVPPDVAADGLDHLPPVLLGRGTEDAWYTEEKMNADLDVLRPAEVTVETCVFEGGHVWADEYLDACGRFIQGLLD